MRFGKLDLNLLVALDMLLSERSVSVAANRLNLSQSATSSALRRLREYFGDELLTQRGRDMVLTARGQQLVGPVREVLDQVDREIARVPKFDPARSDRTFRIMASDYSTEVLLAPLFSRLQRQAPLVRFEVAPLTEDMNENLARGAADILVSPDYAQSADHPARAIFTDDFVVLACAKNEAISKGIDRDAFFALGHVTARFGIHMQPSFEEEHIASLVPDRRIVVASYGFLTIPSLLVGTDHVAVLHRSLARKLCERQPLQMAEAPVDVPPITIAAQWNVFNKSDPGIQWLVSEFVRQADDSAFLSGCVSAHPN